MKIYLSGPMTGLPDHNRPAFAAATEALRAAGHIVISPAENDLKVQEENPDATWLDYIIADLHLLRDCDAMAQLPGWEQSTGARIEAAAFRRMGRPVRLLAEFLLPKWAVHCLTIA